LAITDLLQDEYDKLRIKTKAATLEEVHERLTLTGWIMARPGNEVTLTAPAAGYVRLPKDKPFPIPGQTIGPNTEILAIEPVLSPIEKIQADALERSIRADKTKAETTLELAKKDHDRVEKMFAQKDDKGEVLKLKNDQEREAALKAYKHAQEELAAAEAKLKLFALANRPIMAPQRGTVLQVHVGVGQYVQAGAPLAVVIDLEPIWIRVPVPESDLPAIDRLAHIEIVATKTDNDRPDDEKSPHFAAVPTGHAAQVDPIKHTAELWYQLDKTKITPSFVKDQMVTARLKVGRKEQASVVPYSAIVFDSHGSAWIYVEQPNVKEGKHLFERRRVELVASVDTGIVVRPMLTKGDLVVVHGAAALLSREFHKPPVRPK